jgi:IS5 family transposase
MTSESGEKLPAYERKSCCRCHVLRVSASRQAGLWELVTTLGVRVGELPGDLAVIDRLLADPGVYAPVVELWRAQDVRHGTFCLTEGRRTIAIETLVRLMVVKVRNGWGYGRLVGEVGDSVHLRRFCMIGLGDVMPDESTLRKLVIRLGAVTVEEVVCGVIACSAQQTKFRPRAIRIDSTVVEADIRFPTDSGLAADGVGLLARFSREHAGLAGEGAPRVRDRSRAAHGQLRRLGRSLKRRSGEAKQEVLEITGELGESLKLSIAEAQRLQTHLAAGGEAQQRAAERLTTLLVFCRRVVEQIGCRLAGERITDRLVSLHDSDARPICKGKLAKRTEFGYVHQVCEITSKTIGARGYILPSSTLEGNPGENELLPATLARLDAQQITIREAAVDGGFGKNVTAEAFHSSAQGDSVIVWNPNASAPASKRTSRRLYRYRAGAEGRISHLKGSYGMRRSRLRGAARSRAWCAWAILTYNLDTHAVRCTT